MKKFKRGEKMATAIRVLESASETNSLEEDLSSVMLAIDCSQKRALDYYKWIAKHKLAGATFEAKADREIFSKKKSPKPEIENEGYSPLSKSFVHALKKGDFETANEILNLAEPSKMTDEALGSIIKNGEKFRKYLKNFDEFMTDALNNIREPEKVLPGISESV